MGKNISVYLNDDLLNRLESSGLSPSQVVQAALKKYFHPVERSDAAKEALTAALSIGKAPGFGQAVSDCYHERDLDRW